MNSTLEIYIDRATIPTLQQAIHLAKSNSNNRKFIFWDRFKNQNHSDFKCLNANFFTSLSSLIKTIKREQNKYEHIYMG